MPSVLTIDDLASLPGYELVAAGLADLTGGDETVASLLVLIAANALRDVGIAVHEPRIAEGAPPYPEHRLYLLLAREDQDSAHGRYNALLRRLVSFERALACAR